MIIDARKLFNATPRTGTLSAFCAEMGLGPKDDGARQLAAEIYKRNSDDTDNLTAMARALRREVQTLRAYAYAYYHSGKNAGYLPDSVLTAYLAHRLDARLEILENPVPAVGQALTLLKQEATIHPGETGFRRLADAYDGTYRDAAFLSMALLNVNLKYMLLELRRPDHDPEKMPLDECEPYTRATAIYWPASHLSADNARLAKKLRNILGGGKPRLAPPPRAKSPGEASQPAGLHP